MMPRFLSFLYAFIAVAIITLTLSCGSSDPDPIDCTGFTPTYTTDLQPIFAASCSTPGCHGSTNPAHDINLASYAGAVACAQNHDLRCSIEHLSGCDAMPEDGNKLPADQIKKIVCWLQNGMLQ